MTNAIAKDVAEKTLDALHHELPEMSKNDQIEAIKLIQNALYQEIFFIRKTQLEAQFKAGPVELSWNHVFISVRNDLFDVCIDQTESQLCERGHRQLMHMSGCDERTLPELIANITSLVAAGFMLPGVSSLEIG